MYIPTVKKNGYINIVFYFIFVYEHTKRAKRTVQNENVQYK